MTVQELMSRTPYTCTIEDTLNAPAGLMWEHDVGAVPVLGEASRVVGMITDRDICMASYTKGRPLGQIQVREVLSREVVTCRPTDSLAHAEKLMREFQVRRLPVVDSFGLLVGVLSLNDLVREAGQERGSKTREVDDEEVMDTLGAIGTRRLPPLAWAS